jgi:hypothetical protein
LCLKEVNQLVEHNMVKMDEEQLSLTPTGR